MINARSKQKEIFKAIEVVVELVDISKHFRTTTTLEAQKCNHTFLEKKEEKRGEYRCWPDTDIV